MKGIVIRSTGSFYNIKAEDGLVYDCKLKGNLRILGIKNTNPIAVGDRVLFSPESNFIIEIFKRSNYIIRKSTKLSKQTHIIAANIDQCFIVVTLVAPRTSLGFIDRFLVTAEAYGIPAIIVFNKIDNYNEQQLQECENVAKIYETIGYKTIKISATQNINFNNIVDLMKGKVTLISGHSGVGKSTIINKMCPNLNLKTLKISEAHQKGVHATTFAEMFEVSENTFIIDTPGIKEFGIYDFGKDELCHYFPEFFKLLKNCTFNNCSHTHEPGCAVIKAVNEGVLSQERYKSYLSIIADLE